ncbi:MAG: hypothetical protein WBF75_16745 [Pseudonocardiaceae bacterium]
MPAFDFVCGWTINPSPGTRITVPSILSVPASASTFVQSSASQRRAVVTAVLESVIVHPATVIGRNPVDSDRLEPRWRA